ncbi:M16 family metallopeptidase [Flammeovirga agarivorans]|uniref:Insulinase family protein n=1 Tax=Flammeovirga agarivorans TaxID=2726742 RepID=A0A7X8SG87_9BACT|nr:pitrilysin family protein [Flammeovirga agarivorans]NLR89685.1 insulinase family protein [Flammeovirga agarivorans]
MKINLDRTIAPDSYPVEDFVLLKPEIFSTRNQCKVFSLKNASQPILHFSIVIKGGKLVEEKQGAAALTSKMMGEGVKGMTSAQIHEYLDSFGAIISVSNDIDSFTITGHCLNRYFEPVMEMVKRYLTEPTFSEKEFQHILQVMIQQKILSEEKTSFLATKLFREKFYGNKHPYGSSLTSAELSEFPLQELENYFNNHVIGAPFEVFISGDVDDKHIKIIDEQLGDLNISSEAANLIYPDFVSKIASDELKIYQEKEDAVQTSLRIGCPTFKLPHDDLEAFSVMNETLGGYFGSRLMRNIREDKGLSYGIHSSFRNEINQGYFLIASDVKKDLKDLAIDEIRKEIDVLATEVVSQEELLTVKNYMAGSFVMSINSNISLLEITKGLYKKGLPFDYYDNYVSRIQSITEQDIMAMVNKYLKGDLLEIAVG